MRSFVLSSGSSANCFYVEDDKKEDCILIDCGLSYSKTCDFLNKKNINIKTINCVFITHEHSDHIYGFEMLYQNLECIFYMTLGTFNFLSNKLNKLKINIDNNRFKIIKGGNIINLNNLSILVVDKPHDASEPVSFIVKENTIKHGFFTDLGHVTSEIKNFMKNLDVLYIETNYCDNIINIKKNNFYGNYISRLVSNVGHLSINQACMVLKEVVNNDMKVILSHISENTNTYTNSYIKVKDFLKKEDIECEVFVSFQKQSSNWF